jgi:hypothetical protein
MNKSLILNKIKEHLEMRYDKDLADFLGIKTTTLAMWHSRNTYDVELLFNKCEFLNPEWLLTGKGSMVKSEPNTGPFDLLPDAMHYKDLAEARLEIIEGLKYKIADLEKQVCELKESRKESFLYSSVAEPADQLTDKDR